MNTQQIFNVARKHLNNGATMASSAAVCMDDAVTLESKGNIASAQQRALTSLRYSVGIFHADYQAVAAAIRG